MMQKRQDNEKQNKENKECEVNPMVYTAHELAPKIKLSPLYIPHDIYNALKTIYHEQRPFNFCTSADSCNEYLKCIESLSQVQRIFQCDYLYVLKLCLYLLQFEIDYELKQHTLLNHTVKKFNLPNRFIIDMRSISKYRPIKIKKYDIAILTVTGTKIESFTKIVKVMENQVIIEASSSEDTDKLNANIIKENKFDIKFRNYHWPLKCCHYAISIISLSDWTGIVYPQLKPNVPDIKLDIKFLNTNIERNERQKQAVRKILNNTARPAPYIVFGPPGTGKTATLVEAICQIVAQYPMKHILVCTVSNAAADEITRRLIRYIDTSLIHRMYAPSREWSSVAQEIQSSANFVEENTLFLSKDLLLLKNVIITTLISSLRLIGANLWENHFSYIIIDEASQATEPEMLIPLAITNTADDNDEKDENQIRPPPQIVIAGDPYQLGPVVRNNRVEHILERSMLERLMNDCEPYKEQNGVYDSNYITKLVQNYRSHDSLLYVSNKQFYKGDLVACGGTDTQMALNWSHLPNKNFPMIFQEVLGIEKRSTSQSVSNMAEILAVLVYVDILINTGFGERKITPQDIGIITPFKRQELDIKYYLAVMNVKGISVGTVEIFQGQERNVIIFSAVRSQIFTHNEKEHIGFLTNPKRFNVAITRAKALMITIGNPHILCTNKHWKVLWEYCNDNGGYIPFEDLPLKSDIVANLKKNFGATLRKGSATSNTNKLSVTMKHEKEESGTSIFNELVRIMESINNDRLTI